MKQVAKTASAVPKRCEHKSTVGDTLAARRAHPHWVVARDTWNNTAGLSQDTANHLILHARRLLLVGLSNPRKQDDLLLRTRVLLVDLHDIEQSVDREETRCRDGRDAGVLDGHGKAICLERASKTANTDLAEHAELASNFSLEDHANRDTLSVEDRRSENSLNSMSDGVSKIDKVTETGFAFVERDNMGLDANALSDNVQEK